MMNVSTEHTRSKVPIKKSCIASNLSIAMAIANIEQAVLTQARKVLSLDKCVPSVVSRRCSNVGQVSKTIKRKSRKSAYQAC